MKSISEALAEHANSNPRLCVEVNIREYVDLVDSVKTEPTTEVGKEQLAAARKSAAVLRGNGGKCCPSIGQLKMLVNSAAPRPATTKPTEKN